MDYNVLPLDRATRKFLGDDDLFGSDPDTLYILGTAAVVEGFAL